MTVEISPEDHQAAERLVASGRFPSVSAALHAGLEAVHQDIEEEAEWIDYVRERIAIGLEDVRERRTISSEAFLAELEEMRLGRL